MRCRPGWQLKFKGSLAYTVRHSLSPWDKLLLPVKVLCMHLNSLGRSEVALEKKFQRYKELLHFTDWSVQTVFPPVQIERLSQLQSPCLVGKCEGTLGLVTWSVTVDTRVQLLEVWFQVLIRTNACRIWPCVCVHGSTFLSRWACLSLPSIFRQGLLFPTAPVKLACLRKWWFLVFAPHGS